MESANINAVRTSHYPNNPRPQDSGNHEDYSWVELSDGQGKTIRIEAVGAPSSFPALPWTAEQIALCKHDDELPPSDATYLNIRAAVLGLGNSSCGPGVLKKYARSCCNLRVRRVFHGLMTKLRQHRHR